jgi:hypothetical protein
MRQLARALFIALTLLRFGIDDIALSGLKQRWIRGLARVVTIGRRFDEPRGVRLRRAFERLGPIFICCPPTSPMSWRNCRTMYRPFRQRKRRRSSSARSASR